MSEKPGRHPWFGLGADWWPVAFAEEVKGSPVGVRLGEASLALYRDSRGMVRAVEDRCPHRRMPLSMGRVTTDGHLQCPYHGWCFDGETGQCVVIPNLGDHEQVSPSIRVPRAHASELVPLPGPRLGEVDGESGPTGATMLAAAQTEGFITVWTGDEAPEMIAPTTTAPGPLVAVRTSAVVRAPFEQVMEALAWNPGSALGLGALLGSGDELRQPRFLITSGSSLRVERERLTVDFPRVSSYDALIRRAVRIAIHTNVGTGLSVITVESGWGDGRIRVVVALTPLQPFRTVVRARTEVQGPGAQLLGGALKARAALDRIGRRVAGRVEVLADEVGEAVDGPLDALRDLRRRHVGSPGHTAGSPQPRSGAEA